MTTQTKPATPPAVSNERARLILLACILASSLVGMDGLMTTVALPAIADALNGGLSVQQWIVAAFLLALGSLILVGGALGDVVGRRRIFTIGTAGFGLGALFCGLAPNAPLLIAGRLVQGAAAALLLPCVLAILTLTFEGEHRSKAIARWSAWSGLSVIAGPLVGGLLISTMSWRAIYWVQLPCAAAVMLLIGRAIPADTDGRHSPGAIDLGGAMLAAPAVGGPAFYLIQGPQVGWTNPLVLGALGIGLVCLAGFLLRERRARNPLLPLILFKIRTFTALNVVTFVLYGALISCGTYTVLFLQDNLGYAPAAAGVAAAVPIMVLFVLSSRFGALADRYGGKLFIGGGAIVAGLGMLMLLRIGSGADLWTVVLPSVLVHGLGLSMLVAPLTSGVMSSVPEERAGIASGVNNAVARTGSMMAIAVIGAIISLRFSTSVESRLDGNPLSARMEIAVAQARERPLSDTPIGPLTPDEQDVLGPVLADASADAFRAAVTVMGGLALLAGSLAWVGIPGRSRRRYDACGTLGCPITGARTHPDAAPIGSHVMSSQQR